MAYSLMIAPFDFANHSIRLPFKLYGAAVVMCVAALGM